MPHKTVTDKDGNDIPSVTTIISTINKPFLNYWYGKYGTAYCERKKRESQEHGTAMHELIEAYLLNRKTEKQVGILHKGFCEFKKWHKKQNWEIVLLEPKVPMQCHCFEYPFQGTFDALVKEYEEYKLYDWKTSNAHYPEAGLQLAAYAHLVECNMGKLVNEGTAVRIDKETGKIDPKTYFSLPKYFNVFKSLIPVYQFVNSKGEWKKDKC